MRATCPGSTFFGSRQRALRFMSMMDGKVQEQIDSLHLGGSSDHLPVEVQTVGIEQAEAAPVVFPPDSWKNLLQKNLVAVAVNDVDVRLLADRLSQGLDLVAIEVDEEVLLERWLDLQRVQRAALDPGSRGLR